MNGQKKVESTVLCAVDYAFKRIGGKYKGMILWHLSSKLILRYGELKRTIPRITTKMLTQTLRELEDDQLIKRKMYHQVPPKVEYSLSEAGHELIPFIEYLHHWGQKQMHKDLVDHQSHEVVWVKARFSQPPDGLSAVVEAEH